MSGFRFYKEPTEQKTICPVICNQCFSYQYQMSPNITRESQFQHFMTQSGWFGSLTNNFKIFHIICDNYKRWFWHFFDAKTKACINLDDTDRNFRPFKLRNLFKMTAQKNWELPIHVVNVTNNSKLFAVSVGVGFKIQQVIRFRLPSRLFLSQNLNNIFE